MNKISAIVWKDLITEFRTRDIFVIMAAFSILMVVVFNFSLNLSRDLTLSVIPSLIWISFVFVGILGLGRSFAVEKENNAIVGILLSPTDRSVIFIAKMITNLLFLFAIQLILVPLFVLFFNLDISGKITSLALVLILGTLGFVSVGTLFSTMAINTKLREVILPILLFPIIIPIIINAVRASAVILNGGTLGEVSQYLKILLGFDVIFFVTCALIYEYVVDESY